MTPDHGTRGAYWRGCRCQPCRDGHRRYLKAWRHDVGLRRDSNGQTLTNPRLVPAAPVAAHVADLLASGWTRAAICRDAGLWHSLLTRLTTGESTKISRDHAAALLALLPLTGADDSPDDVMVQRLLAGTADRRAATLAERLEAARRARGRDRWATWCADALGLRHDAIRRLRDEEAA